MRSEWVVGLLNALGVACIVGGPEITSIVVSAVAGAGCFAMSLGVILVESCQELASEKEKEDGAR